MSDPQLFFPSEDQDSDEPSFMNISMEEVPEMARSSNMLRDFSGFEVPPSIPLQQVVGPSEIPCSEKGQPSGTKRKQLHATDMQTKEILEDGEKEDHEASEGCKQQKRTRSSEVHNLNERLRRQKLQEKIKALQELIPNCEKRDKASILDDAIEYLKTLRYQVQEHQMMSMGAGFSMHHSTMVNMPQPSHQAMQLPTSFPPFPNTAPRGISGIEYGTGMTIPTMFSPLDFPMGLPHSRSLESTTSGGLLPPPLLPEPRNVLEPLHLQLSPSIDWATLFSSGSQWEASGSSQLCCKNELCPIPVISEQLTRSGSAAARVLPSQVILPHYNKEAKDYGSCQSGSSDWATSSSNSGDFL